MNSTDFEVQRALGRSAISLVKGLGLTLIGAATVFLAVTTPGGGVLPDGWLYRNLGPGGAQLALAACGVVVAIAGLFWTRYAFRGITRARAELRRIRGQ